jgi:hypothetical protein
MLTPLDAGLIGRVIIVGLTICRTQVAAGALPLALQHQVLTPLDAGLIGRVIIVGSTDLPHTSCGMERCPRRCVIKCLRLRTRVCLRDYLAECRICQAIGLSALPKEASVEVGLVFGGL